MQGINHFALKDKRFRVQPIWLEFIGKYHPCSRMEENLGTGGYNAVCGNGGITSEEVTEGRIDVGDSVKVEEHGLARLKPTPLTCTAI